MNNKIDAGESFFIFLSLYGEIANEIEEIDVEETED